MDLLGELLMAADNDLCLTEALIPTFEYQYQKPGKKAAREIVAEEDVTVGDVGAL